MSVKRVFVIAALTACSIGILRAQSYYDDDIYYDPAKDVTQKSIPVVVNQNGAIGDYPAADTYTVHNVGTVRDVDEYNRRTPVESDTTEIPQSENFEYTRRIERFYDPQVVASLDDPELVEYYYTSAQPEVNIIIGSTAFNDPWLWDWGWYSPYSYSYWGWNSWYWGYPYSWWRPSWYYGWYHPGWYPGPSWYPGWHPGHYPGHHYPGYHPGGGNRRWAGGSPGGWGTFGSRNGNANRYNGGRGDSSGYKPGNATSKPGGNTGGYRSGNRRGQGSGTWNNNSGSSRNSENSRSSYNSGSNSGRRSGFSSGSSGSGSRGGFGGGGHRGGGGGGGRGGRR